jgi:hypothetical protein
MRIVTRDGLPARLLVLILLCMSHFSVAFAEEVLELD